MALRFNKATANDLARRAEALREIVDEMKARIEEADGGTSSGLNGLLGGVAFGYNRVTLRFTSLRRIIPAIVRSMTRPIRAPLRATTYGCISHQPSNGASVSFSKTFNFPRSAVSGNPLFDRTEAGQVPPPSEARCRQ